MPTEHACEPDDSDASIVARIEVIAEFHG